MDYIVEAHGIGGQQDLPISLGLAISGAVAALVVSFTVLAVAWREPRFDAATSGRPAPVYVTTHDHFAYLHACSTRQELIGLKNTDLLANLFPLTTFPMGA